MADTAALKMIARIRSDFTDKFGIPRQSGLVDTHAAIVMEPEYRVAEAFRGIEGYSHLWLIWQFSEALREDWSPTIRPPRLGGNKRMGVFASRSPFRPNAIGLSSVKLERVELNTPEGPILWVTGADLLDGTPIFDIKPYLSYTDSHPEASAGFALDHREGRLQVTIPDDLLAHIPPEKQTGLQQILAQDPRPGYQQDPERIYGMDFGGFTLHFKVVKDHLIVTDLKKSP